MNEPTSLDSLTAKQCECLELVLHHLTSKQIALELGISPHTVNQRLDSARQRLGAATRHEAAILYARMKGIPESFAYHTLTQGSPENSHLPHPAPVSAAPEIPERLIHEPFMLADLQENPLTRPVTAEEPMLTFAEAPTRGAFAESSALGLGTIGKVPTSMLTGTAPAHQEIIWRLFHIFGLAAAIMVMILIAVATAEGMTRIFHGH